MPHGAVAVTDGTGTIQTEYTYEPFGAVTTTGTSSTNAYQFTGRETDGTGLHYYRARYYSPTLKRFISEDPIGFAAGDPNLYSYIFNSPLRYRDPLGLWAAGISGELNWINPFTSGGGDTYGINLQYTSDTGLGLYTYTTSAPPLGLQVGLGVQLNVATGNGSWEGPFTNYEGNIGPLGGGYFRSSDLNPGDTFGNPEESGDTMGGRKPPEGYEGITFGGGAGLDYGASESTVEYTQQW